ncbi:imelysin family protein [Bermanella sp. R86510]|uniref:imelysin family protein n=1 Tax=unclassified Bermanella TaxID=2627862 RepID=UPI0037CB867F
MKSTLITAALSIPLILTGCGSDSDTANNVNDACSELNDTQFNCGDMLTDLVEKGVRPVVAELSTSITSLDTAVDAYCEETSEANKTSAQDAWKDAVANVQQLQPMAFGPLTDGAISPIYSWPVYNVETYDTDIVSNDSNNDFSLSGFGSRKGLLALEYILFTADGTITSEADSVTNWKNGKSDADIQTARCDYAQLVSDDLVIQANTLQDEWQNFELASSANSQQAAANTVTQAFFYADKQIKDAKVKLALPQDSAGVFDASKLESQYANISKEHLINNLEGLKRIFTAADGVGIDDYLIAADQEDVATTMLAQIDVSIANLEAIDGTLSEAVLEETTFTSCSTLANNGSNATDLSDIEELCKFQHTIKQLTDTLKGDFVLSTQFTVPASASGDND